MTASYPVFKRRLYRICRTAMSPASDISSSPLGDLIIVQADLLSDCTDPHSLSSQLYDSRSLRQALRRLLGAYQLPKLLFFSGTQHKLSTLLGHRKHPSIFSSKCHYYLRDTTLDFGRDIGIAWGYIAGFTQNLVWEILFAIYLLCLLLCKVIIILMQFLQKMVVVGFKLYTPIAVAEYAHRSLRSKAIGFFLTFVGVLAWPVGWSLVNAITFGVFKSLPAPQDQNFATLMIAIVLAVPVLLWVLIGHVMAPIFVQKVVIRGGAVIQGFAGTIFSAVGASSMAIYSGGLAGSANGYRNVKRNYGQDVAEARWGGSSRNQRPGDFILEPFDGSGTTQGETDAQRGASFLPDRKEPDRTRRGLSNFGAGMMGAGASMMNRFGSVARFIGHAVVEGSGDGSGLEYRALAAFAPVGTNTRSSTNQTNRSSLQARRYLDEQ